MHLIAHTDGAALPSNPGHAACGYILETADGAHVEAKGIYLGWGTNNVAEYCGVGKAIAAALAHGATHLDIRSDSQLVVNQVSGSWQLRSEHLRGYRDRVLELLGEMGSWSIMWIPRKRNTEADALANQAARKQHEVEGVLQ